MKEKKTQKEASTGPKASNAHELELRRQYVNELYLQGKYQADIAALVASRFGYEVTQQTISNDLRAVKEQWMRRSTALINEHIAEELAKIDQLEREYQAMFEKSKGKNGRRLGDVKYKMRVEWCIDRRCQLLGVDAPKRTEISGVNGGPIRFEDVRQRFLGRIASIVQRRRANQVVATDKR